MFENQNKKRNYGNKKIVHKSSSKRLFRNGIHSSIQGKLMSEEALTSFTVSDAYR